MDLPLMYSKRFFDEIIVYNVKCERMRARRHLLELPKL